MHPPETAPGPQCTGSCKLTREPTWQQTTRVCFEGAFLASEFTMVVFG